VPKLDLPGAHILAGSQADPLGLAAFDSDEGDSNNGDAVPGLQATQRTQDPKGKSQLEARVMELEGELQEANDFVSNYSIFVRIR